MITIRAKTRSGAIQTFEAAEIIEIDGKPYSVASPTQELAERVAHLEGVVETLCRAAFEEVADDDQQEQGAE